MSRTHTHDNPAKPERGYQIVTSGKIRQGDRLWYCELGAYFRWHSASGAVGDVACGWLWGGCVARRKARKARKTRSDS